MLPDLIIDCICTYITNPFDYISFIIQNLKPHEIIPHITQLKSNQDFIERLWMFNCGILARCAFSSPEDNNIDCMRFHDDGPIFHLYDYLNDIYLKNQFFKIMFTRTYINLHMPYFAEKYYSNDYVEYFKELKNVFGIDFTKIDNLISKNEFRTYIKKFDTRFEKLYDKFEYIFKAGFKYGSSYDFVKYIVTIQKIDKHVNKIIYSLQPNCHFHQSIPIDNKFINKEDHHMKNKQSKRSKYDNKKKEKIQRKRCSSHKKPQRRMKYSYKHNCIA